MSGSVESELYAAAIRSLRHALGALETVAQWDDIAAQKFADVVLALPDDIRAAIDPFGSILHEGRMKGPTAWVRKAIEEHRKAKTVVLVYPIDKWVLMLLKEIHAAGVINLGDVRWCATEDGLPGPGTGRHIAAFILDARRSASLFLPASGDQTGDQEWDPSEPGW